MTRSHVGRVSHRSCTRNWCSEFIVEIELVPVCCTLLNPLATLSAPSPDFHRPPIASRVSRRRRHERARPPEQTVHLLSVLQRLRHPGLHGLRRGTWPRSRLPPLHPPQWLAPLLDTPRVPCHGSQCPPHQSVYPRLPARPRSAAAPSGRPPPRPERGPQPFCSLEHERSPGVRPRPLPVPRPALPRGQPTRHPGQQLQSPAPARILL